MERFKFLEKKKINKFPNAPGVYGFKKGREFLYIGKASNLRERIKNHFQKPGFKESLWLNTAEKIGYIKTPSEIEALILEANLIKKYQPKYNVMWRDDKNYFFVGITKEDFPRVFWTHQTKVKSQKSKVKSDFIGPFVDGRALKITLRFLRKVFPYYTKQKHPKNFCPYCHLGLCPGPNPHFQEYQKNIKNLVAVLKGRKSSVLRKLQKEMKKEAQKENFEKAAKLRDQIRALEKIIAHLKVLEDEKNKKNWQEIQKKLQKIFKTKKEIARIEAYDISNIQGQEATGSMITFVQGKPEKNLYRHFKIKISKKPNDIAMLKEVIQRRFHHPEWGLPDLILIDGGKAQLNAIFEIKKQKLGSKKEIKIMSLAKKHNKLYIEGKKNPLLLKTLPREIFNLILQLRDEAHRFAYSYHEKLRSKKFFA